MSRRVLLVLLVACLDLPAASAAAAGWSHPAVLLRERCPGAFCSPAPDVAVNRHGTVVALFRRDRGLRNFVRIGDRAGRFGRAQALPAGSSPGQAAIADDGTALIAWARKGQVRAAFRRPGHRFGRSLLIARLRGPAPEIDDLLVGLDRTGRLGVVAWTDFRGRTATTVGVRAVDARARQTVGAARELDSADYLSLGGLAVNRAGQAALTWVAIRGDDECIEVVTRAPAGFSDPLRVSPTTIRFVDDPRVALDSAGALAVAYTAVSARGDAGARGVPVARVRPPGAADFGPELHPPAPHPSRLFDPLVAFAAGGRATLLFQRKTAPAGFSRAAPLLAAIASADGTALGAPATLAAGRISEPRVAALGDGRLLSVWQTAARPGAPLAAALSDAAGAFRSTRAPSGRPDPFSDAGGNRGLAVAGRYAAFIWGGGGEAGAVRVSVRRF